MQQVIDVQFPHNILKNLIDKNEERRESACKQLEIIISKNADKKKYQQIQKIIQMFRDKYVKTNDNNKKKVGLDALSSIINGIKEFTDSASKFTPIIITIILECLNEPQPKIRFHALKALYYISKALDDKILVMFNQIFEQIIGKITDLDDEVKNAAKFLDSALQTILNTALSSSEGNANFDLKKFMEILTSKFKAMNPTIRTFLIEWINTLNEIATIDLVIYLPDILEDLLFMLGDKDKELRGKAESCLRNFQKDLGDKFNQGKLQNILSEAVINNIISILIKVAKGKASSYTKLIALNWFNLIFQFFKTQIENKTKSKQKTSFKKIIIQRFDEVLQPILLLMSHQEQEVRRTSLATNDLLMQNIQMINKQETINFGKVMPLLKEMLSEKKSSSTSQTVLRWMKFMLENYNDKILPQINDIIEKLVEKLCDSSNTKNVISIIQTTTVTGQYFQLLIEKMLVILFTNKATSQDRPQVILKRFCSVLQPDKFCRSLCTQIINTFDDKNFIFEIVQSLNYIIITDKSMLKVRKKLQSFESSNYCQFFMALFQAFKYNPAAVTSLCLLSQQYQLAYRIILSFGTERQVTNNVLIGYCKLANLIQCPGFLFLRLQLLEKQKYPYLVDSLSALIMLLPQGKIYNMLRSRLQVAKIMPNRKKVIEQQNGSHIVVQQCLKQFNLAQDMFNKT